MGSRGVSMRQAGISGALHTSLRPGWITGLLWSTLAANVCHNTTAPRWMETAAAPEDRADAVPGPLEPVQCGVIKECRGTAVLAAAL